MCFTIISCHQAVCCLVRAGPHPDKCGVTRRPYGNRRGGGGSGGFPAPQKKNRKNKAFWRYAGGSQTAPSPWMRLRRFSNHQVYVAYHQVCITSSKTLLQKLPILHSRCYTPYTRSDYKWIYTYVIFKFKHYVKLIF